MPSKQLMRNWTSRLKRRSRRRSREPIWDRSWPRRRRSSLASGWTVRSWPTR
jgi:hypothetical protein